MKVGIEVSVVDLPYTVSLTTIGHMSLVGFLGGGSQKSEKASWSQKMCLSTLNRMVVSRGLYEVW